MRIGLSMWLNIFPLISPGGTYARAEGRASAPPYWPCIKWDGLAFSYNVCKGDNVDMSCPWLQASLSFCLPVQCASVMLR